MKLPSNIKKVLDTLENAGYDAYVVGGSLRDALLGRDAHDFDVTSSARPEEVISLFENEYHVIPTGLKHGTVTVVADGEPIEITTFRTDGEYSDSRRPDSVAFAATVEEDLSRRDFTVNAMAYNERRGLVDLFGGREDLENKIIRCVGDAETRFNEDALRIMRAFRFASQLDFLIDEQTLEAAIKTQYRLKNIACERKGSEMLRLLGGCAPSRSLCLMGDIADLVLDAQVDHSRFSLIDKMPPDPIARLALILCGNATQKTASALRLSSKDAQRLKILAAPPSKERLESRSDAEMRRIIAEYRGDAVTASHISSLIYGVSDDAVSHLRRIAAQNPPVSLSDLKINGSDLIRLGVASGAAVGEVLEELLNKVIESPELNERGALQEIALKMVKK